MILRVLGFLLLMTATLACSGTKIGNPYAGGDVPGAGPVDPTVVLPDFSGKGDFGLSNQPNDWYFTEALSSLSPEERDLKYLFGEWGSSSPSSEPFVMTVFNGYEGSPLDQHAHVNTAESSLWNNYLIEADLFVMDPKGSLGLTVYSQFPNSQRYYRVVRQPNSQGIETLQIETRPRELNPLAHCEGQPDTGFPFLPNAWYVVQVSVRNLTEGTLIQTRIWPAGQSAPSHWQAECLDKSKDRLTHGTIGVWSGGGLERSYGIKQLRDFGIRFLKPIP